MNKNFSRSLVRLVILTISFFYASQFTAKAQDYYHGGGLALSSASYSIDYDSPYGSLTANWSSGVTGVFYKATYAFNDHFALSAYPFLGLSLSANTMTGATGSIGIELPANAELYFGELDDEAFFIGGGFVYSYISSSYEGSGAVVGPQFAIGGQTYLQDNLIGARIAYTYGLNSFDLGPEYIVYSESRSLLTLGVYYSFN